MTVLDEYIDRLEHEVENKRYFLRESRDALRDLVEEKQRGGSTIHSRRVAINDKVWSEVMARPMYLPERNDPIGLNLVSTRLEARDESMEDWLKYERQMVELQKNYLEEIKVTNGAMEETIAEFRARPPENPHHDTVSNENQNTTSTLQELRTQNAQHLQDLQRFVQKYLAPNDPDQTSPDEMMSFLAELLEGAAIPKETAIGKAPSLYRLLLRSNMLQESGDTVKLLDLS